MVSSNAGMDKRTGGLRAGRSGGGIVHNVESEMSEASSVPDELLAIRRRIDEIDRGLVELLRERFGLTHEVGLLKASRELDALDARREEEKLKALAALGQAGNLDPDLVRDLFRRIMDEVVRNHEKLRMRPAIPANAPKYGPEA